MTCPNRRVVTEVTPHHGMRSRGVTHRWTKRPRRWTVRESRGEPFSIWAETYSPAMDRRERSGKGGGVPGWPVPAGRRTGLCRPVRTGAGRGGAFLVPPTRHLTLTTLGLVWHPVDSVETPDRAAARQAAHDATGDQRRAALPPGRRVVALGEVDGMPHPTLPTDVARLPVRLRPSRETCPPGEGAVGGCR